ncbi:MAG: hypothetical protein FJ087_15710 [Deltaproteobacteria bacterium]|nr:hypothetical protein [Deltaproteobacteria bacterium]
MPGGAARVGVATAIVAIGCTLVAAPAAAFPGDQAVFCGISYDRIFREGMSPGHGFGSMAGWRYSLADDWNLWTVASYAGFVGPEPTSDLGGLSFGASYVIDAVSWVPEIYAGAGFFSGVARRGWEPDVGLIAGLGFEYRPFKEFGAGFRAQYRFLARQFYVSTGTLSIALLASYHF